MSQPTPVSTPPSSTRPAPATGLLRNEWWTEPTGGHQLHVLEARSETAQGAAGVGILCLHGLFSDARFFLSSNGTGPARYFIDQGCTVYAAELRGHGGSRWPEKRVWDWSFDTYAQQDIPALVRAARERHTGPLFLLAHSMAGYAALAGLGLQPEVQRMLSGVCVLSSAVNDYSDGGLKKALMVRFSSLLSGLLGRFPAKALKQGPADEPAALMRQFADWAPTGAFRSLDGATDYWQALGQVTLPVFSGVGEADVFHASPRRAGKLVEKLGSGDKTLVICGRSHGFASDFGHFDILRGSRAQQEVLPRVHEWMRAHAGGA
ncbi:Lysophospholipase, alpha-beta hydrolase superfamily [Stigmatella aurantiaca]|uniref:Lysophospholipase, alpha-beta hydrolase superfamily n=1 Tax=Stigmatella aurantiaca TaxID=41 RepID=A0A1H7YMZ4_STIAU|nr:alpha/beta fold hydrolase [Stigmatella aurantiaca]SEM47355.1 Lysophospholipase, alpha-beta hydrolase superfamily [Stigmatella aurantiaca]